VSEPSTRPPLVDASGRPARQADDACPQCGADKTKRGPSCGFGVRRPVCYVCGFKWDDEVWHD